MPERKLAAKGKKVTAIKKRVIQTKKVITEPQQVEPQEADQSLLQNIVASILKVNWKKFFFYKIYLRIKGVFTMIPVAEEETQKSEEPENQNQIIPQPDNPSSSHHFPRFFIVIPIFFLLLAAGFISGKLTLPSSNETKVSSSNKYVVFLDEVYDTVQKNYWNKISDDQLINLYVLATNKLTGQLQANKIQNKAALNKMLEEILKNYPDETKKKEFSTMLADMVLANLEPFGRSRLYSQKEEISLQNNVANKNPEVNRYAELGVTKDASEETIAQAFAKKQAEIAPQAESSPEAKLKLAEITQAYKTLSDTDTRKVYDVSGVEPTMEYKLIRPNIFYIHQTKFSPTTLDELQLITAKVDSGDTLHTLILDLRDNVGGAIDLLPYFLGPFIGPNQYAYQFLHQGEKSDFKTLIGWMPGLVRYKQVVVLINSGSQSSTEVMAATLKKYNVGVLLGSKTHGWGTVEKVFPINAQIDSNEHFSTFLVHSLTLREDGLPIEGKGVDPVIDISNPSWENELYVYYNSQELVTAVKEVLNQK